MVSQVSHYHHKFEGGKVVSVVVMPPQAHRELQGKQNKAKQIDWSSVMSLVPGTKGADTQVVLVNPNFLAMALMHVEQDSTIDLLSATCLIFAL